MRRAGPGHGPGPRRTRRHPGRPRSPARTGRHLEGRNGPCRDRPRRHHIPHHGRTVMTTTSTPVATDGAPAQITAYTSYTVFTRTAAAPGTTDEVAAEVERVVRRDRGDGRDRPRSCTTRACSGPSPICCCGCTPGPRSCCRPVCAPFERSGRGRRAGPFLVRRRCPPRRRVLQDPCARVPVPVAHPAAVADGLPVHPLLRLVPAARRGTARDAHRARQDGPRVPAGARQHGPRPFALGDWEWLLSFEAEDLHDLVDMMRYLRYSKARLHVRDELPLPRGPSPRDPRRGRRSPGLSGRRPRRVLPTRPTTVRP
jgi:hypothetical protein